jgi:hypothetical protein
MVRRGSTVRVWQRAFKESPAIALFAISAYSSVTNFVIPGDRFWGQVFALAQDEARHVALGEEILVGARRQSLSV